MSAPGPMPSLPGGVTLVSDPVDQLVVRTPQSRAVVHLQGAQVTSWEPVGEPPVLFLSRSAQYVAGRPVRGGIPICFPWLGAGPARDRHPSHGFARVRRWQLAAVREEDGAVVVVLELHDDEATREVWPHEFTARYEISVGQVLSLSLEVRNTGSEPMTFEESLHNYFAVEDVARTRVEGLDGRTYVAGFRDAAAAARQSGPLRVTGAAELVFHDDGEQLTVVDEVRPRRIRLTSRRSRSTIVWNPGPQYVTSIRDMADDEWSRMLCVETANVADQAVTLAPGETHTLGLEVAVAAAD
ncbi:D-hexose-6-phosphate mutarotase [Georgenia sp. MJ173]|uniref:D-hexose-6-phosphate mutarotase n=1 Tax=Georgenia sunbinii TaxID=3117728 RepID=UPI002F260011